VLPRTSAHGSCAVSRTLVLLRRLSCAACTDAPPEELY
jgi:hypothetical protein